MKIGFCGAGLMGTPIIKRILAAGYQVSVYNRTSSKSQELIQYGATVVKNPTELANSCTHIFLCLFDWQAVQDVVFGKYGLIHGDTMQCVIDHSSLPVDKTIFFAKELKKAGNAKWIDAPVSGGVAGAQAGTLAVMTGGDRDDLNQIETVIMSYAKRITHMGDVGAGQTTKLCNQTIVTITIAAIAEAVTLAQKNGVDASLLNQALSGGWADSTLLQVFVPRMTSAEIPATASINTMLKDLNNITDLAANSETILPITEAIKQLYKNSVAIGLGQSDVSRIIDIYNK